MPAVSNSSPLILLAAIGRLDLLREIYGEVLIPPAVWQEVVVQGAGRTGSHAVQEAVWLKIHVPPRRLVETIGRNALQQGETEAIAAALSIEPGVTIILDDRRARLVAVRFGLLPTGTGGVLALAKRLGVIASFDALMHEIRSAGLYISDAAVDQLRELAGEPFPPQPGRTPRQTDIR